MHINSEFGSNETDASDSQTEKHLEQIYCEMKYMNFRF
jgi:hypothetical protein